ncbi:hypothetical protein ACJX0J_038992, partial [Zea mays]
MDRTLCCTCGAHTPKMNNDWSMTIHYNNRIFFMIEISYGTNYDQAKSHDYICDLLNMPMYFKYIFSNLREQSIVTSLTTLIIAIIEIPDLKNLNESYEWKSYLEIPFWLTMLQKNQQVQPQIKKTINHKVLDLIELYNFDINSIYLEKMNLFVLKSLTGIPIAVYNMIFDDLTDIMWPTPYV